MTLSLEAFDCAVCANLLLDPVVGPCGHDFCKECLESWRQAACSRGRRGNSSCPICRKPLPNELGTSAKVSIHVLGSTENLVCLLMNGTFRRWPSHLPSALGHEPVACEPA